MTGPAEGPRPARHPRRLPVSGLELHARQLFKRNAARGPGVLLVRLQRSDRLRALTHRPDAMRILGEVLDRVDAALRPDDRYAVVSIDEIWIVLAEAGTEGIVHLAATALRDRIGGEYVGSFDDSTPVQVTVRAALGGAWFDQPLPDPWALLQVASVALQQAQADERRVCVLPASSDAERGQRARIEADLRVALEHNALEVHFQPQVLLAGNRCTSVEALLRWPREPGHEVSPATVAAISEERGLMPQLTQFILHTTLRHMSGWQSVGLALKVGINLSALTLSDPSFPEQVLQACETWGVEPSSLLFELTEGTLVQNQRATIAFMSQLRGFGCELAIDDFGTGYSSLAYLRQFPVNELKIDRMFVRNLIDSAADRRIAKTIVELAHTFGLRALAEGAEDTATVEVLRRLGCDAIQGWAVARAMPGAEVVDWVRRFNAPPATPKLPEAALETA